MNTSDASSNPKAPRPVLTPEQIAANARRRFKRAGERGSHDEFLDSIILSAITQALEQEKKEESGLEEASTATTHVRQKDGIALIAAERHRQISQEGWTADHDDRHDSGELAIAAMCYAAYAGNLLHPYTQGDGDWRTTPPEWWPWGKGWWKPTDDPVHALEKAGALIAAEIDRWLRLEAWADNSVGADGSSPASGALPQEIPAPSGGSEHASRVSSQAFGDLRECLTAFDYVATELQGLAPKSHAITVLDNLRQRIEQTLSSVSGAREEVTDTGVTASD